MKTTNLTTTTTTMTANPPDLDQHRTRNRMATFLPVHMIVHLQKFVVLQEGPIKTTRRNANNSEQGIIIIHDGLAVFSKLGDDFFCHCIFCGSLIIIYPLCHWGCIDI